MDEKESYYVLRDGNTVHRVAKIIGTYDAYGFENGKWVSMPGLLKIQNDANTDYEEISKEEADAFTRKEA